eukprot:COSAG01_NODE_65609_length_272_cov_11.023121_1_plen_41_part_10
MQPAYYAGYMEPPQYHVVLAPSLLRACRAIYVVVVSVQYTY